MPEISTIDRYAVMGDPISHSLSPQIHSLFAQQTDQALQYEAQRVESMHFITEVQHFGDNGGKGLNITLPLKELAWEWVPQCSERAELARAVNTIIFKTNGEIVGDNTDGIGLVRDLQQNLHINLTDKRILIIGAGGATRGILPSLIDTKPQTLHIANRTPEKAQQIADDFSQLYTINTSGLGDDLQQQQFDVVINASAASLADNIPNVPETIFAENSVCYDLCYGAKAQPFLQWANQHGAAQCHDGLGMLVEQAAESFYLWRGVRPDSQQVLNQIRKNLL